MSMYYFIPVLLMSKIPSKNPLVSGLAKPRFKTRKFVSETHFFKSPYTMLKLVALNALKQIRTLYSNESFLLQ